MRRRTTQQALGVVAALAAAFICWHPHLGDVGGPSASADNSPVASSLPGLLAQVRVVDDIRHVPGYERSCKKGQGCVFGSAWNDPQDTSGCDTRNRILAKSLKDVQFKAGTRNCKVIAGHLSPDPYTGTNVDLHQVGIDHIVPLRVSWDAGASQWNPERRREFANDTSSELLAVSSSANSSKGDSTPSEWLPRVGQCQYVIRYFAAATKWQLPVTVKDRAAAIRACSNTRLANKKG